MNQITVEHLNEALNAVKPQADGKYLVGDLFNAAQKLAEQVGEYPLITAEQVGEYPLITAEEARKLGAGNAQYRYRNPMIRDSEFSQWEYCQGVCEESTHNWQVQYRLIRKQPKQVSWKDMPAGVAVTSEVARGLFTWQGCNEKRGVVVNQAYAFFPNPKTLKLAPAEDQPWIPVIAPPEGIMVEYSRFHECMRITGLAEGWVLK